MDKKRRDFIRLTSLSSTGLVFGNNKMNVIDKFLKSSPARFNMHGYAAPKLETVRVGIVGVGSRGSGTVMRLASIEGVEIKALCDIVPERVKAVKKSLDNSLQNPDSYTDGEDAWKTLCDREDIDLVYIATPWNLHASVAVYAMESDKHVYTEIPIGTTIEECWQVVETSENTRKHCFMGCSSCHKPVYAAVLNMVRQGFFGELIHGEGSYIHDRISDNEVRWFRDMKNDGWFGYRPWRLKENIDRNGNLYPEHGLAPVAQMMDINYGDKMDYMVSISSNDFSMGPKMEELAQIDDYYKPYVGLSFRGNMNTTIIRTHRGRTIMLQHDISSPRPGRRFDLISGTKGIYKARPDKIAMGDSDWFPDNKYKALIEEYTPDMINIFNEKVNKAGGIAGSRSYERVTVSDWRLIDCLRNGLPLDMDVYDAALWSSIAPLSEWSVKREGNSVKIPDFTVGNWRTNKRGMDISLQNGGGTTNLVKKSN